MRRRLLSILKWTLTTLLALLVALEVASVWYSFAWGRHNVGGASEEESWTRISISRGALSGGSYGSWDLWALRFEGYRWVDGFSCQRHPVPPAVADGSARRSARFTWWSFSTATNTAFRGPRQMPLTLPILALALPAAWLWFTDTRARRRRRAGRCRKCGYDLTGLPLRSAHTTAAADRASPICPECGAA